MSRTLNELLQDAMKSPDHSMHTMLSHAAFEAEHYALLCRQAIEVIDAVREGANTKEWAVHTLLCAIDRERSISKNRKMIQYVIDYIKRTF
jgi:hypothetical protein